MLYLSNVAIFLGNLQHTVVLVPGTRKDLRSVHCALAGIGSESATLPDAWIRHVGFEHVGFKHQKWRKTEEFSLKNGDR